MRIRALHLSLNSPVVALDEFPVGPARAGVALTEGPERALRLEIAVRSVRTGQLRCYCSDGEVAAEPWVVEEALSFAEGMGFLFDEDEVTARGDAGEAESVALWRDLLGETADAVAPPVAPPLRVVPVAAAPAPRETIRVTTAPAVRRRLALSKFRLVLGAALAEPEPAGSESGSGPSPGPAETDGNRLLSRF